MVNIPPGFALLLSGLSLITPSQLAILINILFFIFAVLKACYLDFVFPISLDFFLQGKSLKLTEKTHTISRKMVFLFGITMQKHHKQCNI